MNRAELNRAVCAVLTTLADVDATFAPESSLALAIGLDKWPTVRSVLLAGSLVSIKGYSVTLTSKGRAAADQIRAFMAAA